MLSKVNLGIISDQLAGRIGGAESILFCLYDLFPDAPSFFTVYNRDILPERYKDREMHASFIQKLPFALKLYKAYFPFMPFAVELMEVQKFDVIFSSHHCVAKGIIPRPDAVHISYCHSPARYIWDLFWTYSKFNKFNEPQKILISAILQYIRMWDITCTNRIDYFLANSSYTAARIKKYYNRDSEVLFPPVNIDAFKNQGTDDFYLMVGRLVAYKGFEAAVDAFNESGKKLVIIGDGPEFDRLKSKAGKNISLLGSVPFEVLNKHMKTCKAFIYPGREDFGIVMAEAQAAGKPVIAIKAGGALDIVLDNETGLLIEETSIESLNQAVKRSELIDWDHNHISDTAKRFDKKVFCQRIKYLIENYKDLQ